MSLACIQSVNEGNILAAAQVWLLGCYSALHVTQPHAKSSESYHFHGICVKENEVWHIDSTCPIFLTDRIRHLVLNARY